MWYISTIIVDIVTQVDAMIGENLQVVTDEPIEVQDCRKITDHFRGICRIYPHFIKKI